MLTTLAIIAVTAIPAGKPVLALGGLDPVALIAGKEVAGSSKLSASYLRHEYHFANDANRAKFRQDPMKFAAQTGGACGKMGALTGKGSPDRWAVVQGKIFFFASEGCRTSFLANQKSYFTQIPRAPKGSVADENRAKHLIAQMIQAHGGQKALDAASRIEFITETPYKERGVDKTWVERLGIYGIRKILSTSEWDAGQLWFAIDGKRSSDGDKEGQFEMHPAEQRELRAVALRNPFSILKFGEKLGLTADESGTSFTLASDDIWFRVQLDPNSHRIAGLRYRDRHAGPVSDVEVEYSEVRPVNGILLPHAYRVRRDGGAWGATKTWAKIRMNQPLASAWALAFGE